MIVMQIGEEEIGINGEIKEIDVAPQMLMNRTIVPARAVSESLGAAVEWDEARQTVVIKAADFFSLFEKDIFATDRHIFVPQITSAAWII